MVGVEEKSLSIDKFTKLQRLQSTPTGKKMVELKENKCFVDKSTFYAVLNALVPHQ